MTDGETGPQAGAGLTLERLFADPDLSGPAPRTIRWSPNADRIGFLRAGAGERLRYDLWAFSSPSAKPTCSCPPVR